MVDSIAVTLGAGSGIDVGALVTSLVEAQYSAKTAQFEKRTETLMSQVSAVSSLKSGITGFATALASLVKGGTLATSATSSNAGIVKATALPGATISTLNATVEVRGLASAQVAATTVSTAAGAATGTGSLAIQFGSNDEFGVFQPDGTTLPPITIDPADATLTAIAAKINAAGAGITASVITDGGGERLIMKGASGAARAFTITATEIPGDEGLAALNVGAGATGTSIATQAVDARIAIDGVEVRRATNSISDLVPGVRLDLQSVAVGTRVTLGSTPASDALKQAVNDVVATYNELFAILKEATDPVTGTLSRDIGSIEMQRALRNLTFVDLTGATDGSPTTLAEIGVTTNRDGTLSVDSTKLARAVTASPDAVEAMFSDKGLAATGQGLSSALTAISTAVTSKSFGLGASETRYTKAKSSLTDEQAKLLEQQEATRTRLTQQYASMDSRVAAYKSTQAFLTQQIDAWNAN